MDATSAPDMLTVLQNVSQFYETSWNHLLVCGSVAVAIVGVVVPVLLQIYQTRTMRHERDEIRAAIAGQVTTEMRVGLEKESTLLAEKIAVATKLLEEKLARDRAELEEKSRKMEGELRKEIARASGAVYHIQANALVRERVFGVALTSGISGLNDYIEADDHFNLRRLLAEITKGCLPNMTKAELDEMEEEKKAFHEVTLRIKKWDVKGDFKDALDDAKRAFKAASERVSVVNPGVA